MVLGALVFILLVLVLLFVYSEHKRAKELESKDIIIPATGTKRQYHPKVIEAARHVLDARINLATLKAARDLLPRGAQLAEILEFERNIHEQEMLLAYLKDRLAWMRIEFPPIEVPE